jgi:LmbE family N-acetylglucosaminyl deacetylase
VPPVALHVAPHPDDEILGCGATLLALRAAGWRVVNLICSLGRPPDHGRRRAELEAAAEVLGIDLTVADPPVAMSGGDDLVDAEQTVAALVTAVGIDLGPDLIISPHPEDGHPGHALVGRAVTHVGVGSRWWAWSLWRDLPAPNRYVPYGRSTLDRLRDALACHAGELTRNRYDDLLPARSRVQAVLGSERVLGFGSGPASVEPFADLLEESARAEAGRWRRAGGGVVGIGRLYRGGRRASP